MFILNNCSYLLIYNYQRGIIDSKDSNIAIIKNIPIKISLQKNLFNRKGTSTREENYIIKYTNGIEIAKINSYNEEELFDNAYIEMIAADAKKRCPSAKGGTIKYLKEENYAIITLTSDESYGLLLGEYFYHNGKYIKKINTDGSLYSVIYYGK